MLTIGKTRQDDMISICAVHVELRRGRQRRSAATGTFMVGRTRSRLRSRSRSFELASAWESKRVGRLCAFDWSSACTELGRGVTRQFLRRVPYQPWLTTGGALSSSSVEGLFLSCSRSTSLTLLVLSPLCTSCLICDIFVGYPSLRPSSSVSVGARAQHTAPMWRKRRTL